MIDLDAWELKQLTTHAAWRTETAKSKLGRLDHPAEARAEVERDAQRWRELLAKLRRAG